jgi:hypothetical protein
VIFLTEDALRFLDRGHNRRVNGDDADERAHGFRHWWVGQALVIKTGKVMSNRLGATLLDLV